MNPTFAGNISVVGNVAIAGRAGFPEVVASALLISFSWQNDFFMGDFFLRDKKECVLG